MKHGLFLFSLLCLFMGTMEPEASAQDPKFAQFYASPLQLNPAMTGVFEGRWRVNANYRDQWSSVLKSVPFRTAAAAFDMRYRVGRSDYFGFGMDLLHDEVGIGKFQTDRAHLNLSFIKQLSGGGYRSASSYMVAGAQAGLGQHGVDWNQFWFSTQFDQEALEVNTGQNSGEGSISGESSNTDLYPDFNAGIMWYSIFSEESSFYVGFAANHLNKPNITFFDGSTEALYTRWIGHVGGEFPLSSNGLSVLPAAVAMIQGPDFSLNTGANFRYTNHDWKEVAIRAGAWAHLVRRENGIRNSKLSMEAVTVAFILEMNRVNVGLSYDITMSTFKLANNSRGAFELSFIYTHPAYERVATKCPKF